ncbi:MAG: VanW family protein [Patescibacteria group bacterium]|nr:VanW family protein [Patescibacteria group bacterium]
MGISYRDYPFCVMVCPFARWQVRMSRKLVSQIHPWLYTACVETHRLRRGLSLVGSKLAKVDAGRQLPVRCFTHQSLLLRKLGDVDMRLQYNKVTNLKLAAAKINGVVIRPGETFSLWKLVGKPSAKKGYLEGMVLKDGEAKSDIGGGLCQMANLIFWMVLHTPLTVTERHHHSFDAFPDSGRVLPFGSGATIFYNYLDLQFQNRTDKTFQINVWVTDEHLKGEICSDRELEHGYHVKEKGHEYLFDMAKGQYFRTNSLWREISNRQTGQKIKEELIDTNFSLMKYAPPADARVVNIYSDLRDLRPQLA